MVIRNFYGTEKFLGRSRSSKRIIDFVELLLKQFPRRIIGSRFHLLFAVELCRSAATRSAGGAPSAIMRPHITSARAAPSECPETITGWLIRGPRLAADMLHFK